MVAGALSSVVARIIVHPLDTLKARIQMSGALQSSGVNGHGSATWRAASALARTEGVNGFYRGFGACLLGFAPAQASYFASYEIGKVMTAPLRDAGQKALADVVTGVFQQTVAGVLFTPVDIIKERLQVQTMMLQEQRFTSTWHAVSSIVRQNGPRGLLRGYWVGNAVWLPWNAIMIPTYERSKVLAADVLGREVLPLWAVATCSAASASLAVCLTHPLDVVKTQLQVLSTTAQGSNLTALQIGRRLAAAHGARGFAAGLVPRLLTIVPGNALVWLSYEAIKTRLYT